MAKLSSAGSLRERARHLLRSWSVFLVAVLGITSSILGYQFNRASETQQAEADFLLRVERQNALLQQTLRNYFNLLWAMRNLMTYSEEVTPAEFQGAAHDLLVNFPGVQALEWVPAIRGENRASFEAKMRADGFAGLEIKDRDAGGAMIRAGERPEHLPIALVEPMAGNELVLGYDLAAGPTIETLQQARDSGRLTGTQPFRLVQDRESQLGWVLAVPVYQQGIETTNTAGRRAHFRGYVQAVFRLQDTLSAVWATLPTAGLQVRIEDVTPGNPVLLYESAAELTTGEHEMSSSGESGSFTQMRTLNAAGRSWRVSMLPTPEWITSRKSWTPPGFLLTGLIGTGLVAAYVHGLTRRTALIQDLVERRTNELQDANEQLRQQGRRQQETQSRLELVLSAAHLGTWEWNVQTGQNLYDERWAIMLGYGSGEIEPRIEAWRKLIHPDDVSAVDDALEQHFAGDKLLYEALPRLRSKDGSWRWILTRGSVVERAADGQPLRMSGTHLDVTEHKRVEMGFRRLAKAVEQSSEIVFILDPNGQIEYVNPAYQTITGTNRVAAFGTPFGFAGQSGAGALDFRSVTAEIARNGMWRSQFEGKRADGSPFIAEAAVTSVRDERGEVVSYTAVVRDKTREQELEEQLRFAQKMEAIGQLAGGVAHDFNNLLQVIQGFTLLALDDTLGERERTANLEQVRSAAERASQLTRQLLTFSRRQRLQPADVDLRQLVADMLKMLRRVIGENIDLDFRAPEPVGNVRADRPQIEQVVLNLVLNARDAMPEGGRLALEVAEVKMGPAVAGSETGARAGCFVRLRVCDSGSGMDEETRARIFEPFFTTKPKDKGTGLGLPVVYGVVRQHEGFIQVASALARGSTFDVFLPVAPRSEPASPPSQPQPVADGKGTILLAEDEPAVRMLATLILERAGFRVLAAADGREACALFDQHMEDIRLLVLDVMMPNVNGREAYEHAHCRRPQVPVLFCSGYSEDALRSDKALPPGTQILNKPYTPQVLVKTVQELLAPKTAPSSAGHAAS